MPLEQTLTCLRILFHAQRDRFWQQKHWLYFLKSHFASLQVYTVASLPHTYRTSEYTSKRLFQRCSALLDCFVLFNVFTGQDAFIILVQHVIGCWILYFADIFPDIHWAGCRLNASLKDTKVLLLTPRTFLSLLSRWDFFLAPHWPSRRGSFSLWWMLQ